MLNLIAANDVNADDLLELVGILIILGCLVAAGVAAWRGVWIATLALCGVAIVTAFLLF